MGRLLNTSYIPLTSYLIPHTSRSLPGPLIEVIHCSVRYLITMRNTLLLLLTLLGLIATRGALAGTPSSYNDWVNSLPSCARSCYKTLFDETVKSQCGDVASSTKASDINCLCTASGGDVKKAEEDGGNCMLDNCGSKTLDAAEDITGKLDDFIDMCKKAYDDLNKGTSNGSNGGKFPSHSVYYLLS